MLRDFFYFWINVLINQNIIPEHLSVSVID